MLRESLGIPAAVRVVEADALGPVPEGANERQKARLRASNMKNRMQRGM
jgi:hypothetical protein